LLVSTAFTVIPVVVILVISVEVPLLMSFVPVPMFVVLMAILLIIVARQHPRRCNQGRAQQK
jgi:hypothetical protein